MKFSTMVLIVLLGYFCGVMIFAPPKHHSHDMRPYFENLPTVAESIEQPAAPLPSVKGN